MSDSIPVWFTILLVAAGVAALGIVWYALGESIKYSRLPTKRVYDRSSKEVSEAALAAIEKLQFTLSYVDEQAISFTAPLATGRFATFVAPVVHLVMLPMEEGRTQVEAIGARGPFHYSWHVMAQSLYSELDRSLGKR